MAAVDDLRITPPAERAVIGCILREPGWAADEAARLLRPDDFLGHVERLAFAAAVALAAAGTWPEPTAVFERLKADGHGRSVGGDPVRLAQWLGEAFADQPTAVNLEYFARLVRGASAARQLLAVGTELVRDAGDRLEPVEATAGRFADRLSDLAAGRAAGDVPLLGEAIRAGEAELRDRHRPGDRAGRVDTGFAGIDRLLPGLDPGMLVVVGARPGAGKTALALNVAVRAALRGLPVYFVSLEMGRAEIGQRAAFAAAGLPGGALRAGGGAAADLDRVAAVADELAATPLAVDDSPAVPVERLVAAARRWQRRHGLALLVVDYLQLVAPTDPRAQRREQVEHVNRQLKQAARTLRCPVLALCQLNRDVESRPDPQPRMSDIREAGGIEQDADVVALLWRLPGQPDDAPDVRVGVDIAKHRNGPTGETALLFRKSCTRFDDLPPGF